MNGEMRMWVDVALLVAFPATVATGLFHGPRWFPCYWHTGCAAILVALVLAHLWLEEHGLRVQLRRFRERLYGADPDVRVEEVVVEMEREWDEEEKK